MAAVASFASLLSTVPREGPLEPAVLRDATAVTPSEHDVDRHFAYVERLLREADRIRGFSPIISPRYVAVFAEQVQDGLDAELLLETDLVVRLAADDPRSFASVLAHENVSVYRTDGELPFGLAIGSFDGTERVVIELREGSTMTGVIANDSTASREWAQRVYETYRAVTIPVETDDLSALENLVDVSDVTDIDDLEAT